MRLRWTIWAGMGGLVCVGVVVALWLVRPWSNNLPAPGAGVPLEIVYPLDETVFPPDIAEPTFRWKDPHPGVGAWRMTIEFADGRPGVTAQTTTMYWTPTPAQWREITGRSREATAQVTVTGLSGSPPVRPLTSGTLRIRTSADDVGAPIFFREVNLPFLTAVTDPAKFIRWRLGPVSAREPPPIVLDQLAVCGNCHSFSRDGGTLAMEVDSGNEKGGYAIAPVREDIHLNPETIIDWNDYKRDEGEPTFGLLCQVSPDGRYVVGTVKDRALAVYQPDLMFSQLFFLIKGILAVYDRETRTFSALPGADDPDYVQTNPTWSPDGRYIVFARSRSKAFNPERLRQSRSVLVPPEEADEFLKGGRTFLYDLYRIPFNGGRGGKAEPVAGASNNGKSNYFAKYSPDGRWIVFCQAASFMLLQPDSQLYIIPSTGGEARRLRCNTPRMNSWHSWSPNGRWLVFSSKVNGPYTQLFLTHMDDQGNSTPPVVLDRFTAPERAANIPEFANMAPSAIRRIHENFMDDHSHCRAGDAFAGAGELEEAARMYQRALQLNPRSAEAHTKLGLLLIQGNRFDEGLRHLRTVVEHHPDSGEARLTLAGLLADTGRLEEAEEHCRAALRLNPESAGAHYTLGFVLAERGNADGALAHYQKAAELQPDSAEAHNALALVLARLGRLEEAIACERKALAINPAFAEAHVNLGAALAEHGDIAEAITHYERALELKPDSQEARRNLEALRRR